MTTTIAKPALLAFTLALGAASSHAAEMELIWETEGFKNPDSVAYDAATDQLFITNIDGVPTQLDANGGTARVTMDGKIEDPDWAAIGMSSPAGVVAHNDHLYVADVDRIVVFKIDTHYVTDIFYAKPSAKFLNDIAVAPNGDIYVSDLSSRDIWRLKDERLERWFDGKASSFCRPNGLHAGEDALVIACWSRQAKGQPKGEDAEVGHLMSLTYEDKTLASLGDGKPIGNLDGIQPDGEGGFYLSDASSGKFMRWTAEKGVTQTTELAPGIANFLWIPEHDMLVAPFTKDNIVRAYRLKSGKKQPGNTSSETPATP